MRLRLFYTIFLFLSLLAASFTPASAEGRLLDILGNRKQEKSAGDDGMFGGLSCERLHKFIEKHKDKIEKRMGEGPVPSLTASYGKHAEQNLAAYLPVKPISAPIILMVHGGAWCIGDKAMTKVTLNKVNRWVTKGFIFVSINYRMIPDGADVLMQAQDVADALAYVQKHAKEWDGDADKIIVMGHSAGAHLISLIGADAKFSSHHGLRPWLGSVSLDSASLDVMQNMKAKHPAFYDDAFGLDENFWVQMSPIEQVSNASLPWLGVCSSRHSDACRQAKAFAYKLSRLGIKAHVLEEDKGHGAINGELGEVGPYTDAVEGFMGSLDTEVARLLKY